MHSVSCHIRFSQLQMNNTTSVLRHSFLNRAVFSTLATEAYPTLGMSLSCLPIHNTANLLPLPLIHKQHHTQHSFSRLTPFLFQNLNCHHPLVLFAQANHLKNRAEYTRVGSSATLMPRLFPIFCTTICLSIQQPYTLKKVQCLRVTEMSAVSPGIKK